MLSDGLILALIVLLLIGFGVGAVYALRRLRRSRRVISDRERKWALGIIAVITATKVPTILSLLSMPDVAKLGWGLLLLVPMLFIVNIAVAAAVWNRRLGVPGVLLLTLVSVAQSLNKQNDYYERASAHALETDHVWGFVVAKERKACEGYTDTNVHTAATDLLANVSPTWRQDGGECVVKPHSNGEVVYCHAGDRYVLFGLALGQTGCEKLQAEAGTEPL